MLFADMALAPQSRGISGHYRSRRYISCHYCPCANQGALADLYAAEDDCAAADRRPAPHDGSFQPPVTRGLQRSVVVGGAWTAVVDEDHTVSNKDLVLERDARADEAVAGDLAAVADENVPLDFHERTDTRVRADHAAVKVDERTEGDACPHADVRADDCENG